ncbi:MAG TPA: IPT/TIG domain-containing protein [Bryobacteraceae bacterium]|jgi:hypothetical protein
MRKLFPLLLTLQILFAPAGVLLAQPQTAPVVANSIPSGSLVTIDGAHFGTAPAVTLNGSPLTLVSSTDTQIVAQIPPGLAPGSYTLVVINGQNRQTGTSVVTIGAVGPQGLPGAPGAPGAQGPVGPSDGYSAHNISGAFLSSGNSIGFPTTAAVSFQLPAGSYLVFAQASFYTPAETTGPPVPFSFVRCTLDGANYSQRLAPTSTTDTLYFTLNVQGWFILPAPAAVTMFCLEQFPAGTAVFDGTISAIRVGQLHLQ